MLKWITRWALGIQGGAQAAAPAVGYQPSPVSGKYTSLYTYLENRYANVVVLSFGEIEDLIGFALPELAHTHQEWWTASNPSAEKPSYSDAWTRAGRTASPNLLAQNVCFERTLVFGQRGG